MRNPFTAGCLIGIVLFFAWSVGLSQPIEEIHETRMRIPSAPIDESYDRYQSLEKPRQVDVLPNAIGFQARNGVSRKAALSVAKAEGLDLRGAYYRDIYVFRVINPLDRVALNALASRLETQYSSIVRTAGLVVRADGARRPWLLTNQISFGLAKRQNKVARLQAMRHLGFTKLELIPGCECSYVATLSDDARKHALEIAARIAEAGPHVTYAHPTFVIPSRPRGTTDSSPDLPEFANIDPAFELQWHHDNRGIEDSHRDADIDSVEAWAFEPTTGNAPLIAIIDSSFAAGHPDLEDNVAATKSFTDPPTLIDPPVVDSHGTAVAAIAAATAGNDFGGKGVCPACKLLLLRHDGQTDDSAARAICHAIGSDAKVISNSWGATEWLPSTASAVSEAAVDNDIPVLFAMATDTRMDDCSKDPLVDLSALDESVIAVSSVTDQDGRPPSGIGNCGDVLAPSAGGYKGIVTADVFFNGRNHPLAYDTQRRFGGTSAATPMVAGTIGLMLRVNDELSRIDIQRILQDTADKVDPFEGEYDPETGFSQPGDGTATHAYGRINAYEAVAMVAPFDNTETEFRKRGRGGKDLFIRDHVFDWGNTERPSNELFTPSEPRRTTAIDRSPDIKVDVFPFNGASSFADFDTEEPVSGERMQVHVRIRNRGPAVVGNAMLRLYGTTRQPLPRLPDDFWTAATNNVATATATSAWHLVAEFGLSAIQYSGATSAGCDDSDTPGCLSSGSTSTEPAQVRTVTVPAVEWEPAAGERFSMLAVVHSSEDPAVAMTKLAAPFDLHDPLAVVAWDNNVALWTAAKPSCPDHFRTLLVIALVLAAALLVYCAWRILKKRKIGPAALVALVLLGIGLFVLWLLMPECFREILK